MAKSFNQDEKAIFEQIFYSDQQKTQPVDPDIIAFEIKKPDGTVDDSVIPVSNGPTGYWKAEYVLDQFGTWEWRWITDLPRIVAQGEIWVIQRNVE